jgi:hypothetical protein
MDQDHNPLLLEDVLAEESPSLAEDKCLEVATAKAEGGRRGEGAATATGALPPAPADAEAEMPEAAAGWGGEGRQDQGDPGGEHAESSGHL